jgi:shikimate dehydrogenase
MTGSWRLALLGGSVDGSPSPQMHNAMLRACGLEGEYVARSCTAAELPAILAELRDGRLNGAQVTMPHKRAVAQACDRLAGDAALTESVNTVVVDGDELVGHSTDATGLEAALRHDGLWPAPGGRGVVLGAGGAAAAVVLMLARAGFQEVLVAARRVTAAAELARRMSTKAPVRPLALADERLRDAVDGAEMLVNATPAGLGGLPVDPRRLGSQVTVVDLRYRPRPVDLVEACLARGLRACDGLEMLAQQAAQSFTLWTGMKPSVEVARAALVAAVRTW